MYTYCKSRILLELLSVRSVFGLSNLTSENTMS